MLFVVFGADCDHVGDIYECPQGTYAIGRQAPLQNNFIYKKTQTTKIFVIQTTNYSWSDIIIATLWCIVCGFIQDYCGVVRLRVYFARSGIFSFITGRLCSCCLICVLFTIGSVTAYTSGPSSTCGKKKLNFFENLKLLKKPQPTFKSQNSMKYIYIYIIAKQLSLSQYSYK